MAPRTRSRLELLQPALGASDDARLLRRTGGPLQVPARQNRRRRSIGPNRPKGGVFMFRFVIALASALSFAGASAHAQSADQKPAAEKPAAAQPAGATGGFANQAEKGSYALGFNFGRSLQNRKVEFTSDQVIAGLRDALKGAKPLVSEEEALQLSRHLQNDANRRLQQEKATLALKNREEGTALLETNKQRAGVVALPSGLQ